MKKMTVILMALLLTGSMTMWGFAETPAAPASKKPEVNADIVRGKIVSIDAAKNEIVVKENKTGTEKTIKVDPTVLTSLKIDEKVRVTLKTGTNVAEKVKEMIKPPAETPKSVK